MENKTCKKCGAHWIAGQLYWSTGAKGSEEDLAGLVCNNLRDEEHLCINSHRGEEGGVTWDYRRGFVDGALSEALKKTSVDTDQ